MPKEKHNYLPSTSINKLKLKTIDDILAKYQTLRCESKAGKLAVRLAKEAVFGEDILAQYTGGEVRDLPALPLSELNELKVCLGSSQTTGRLRKSSKVFGVQLQRLLDKLAKDFTRSLS